jgi:hypothetical protein
MPAAIEESLQADFALRSSSGVTSSPTPLLADRFLLEGHGQEADVE